MMTIPGLQGPGSEKKPRSVQTRAFFMGLGSLYQAIAVSFFSIWALVCTSSCGRW
jgi:hypothetical protein